MILGRFAHRGTVAFPREITVDFSALPPVIALHGPNGSGKTTTLDLLAAPFYLSMPFRPGPLHKHFETRGFIDLTWQAAPSGPVYRSRINVDPVAERVEASLFLADGGPALAGPLAKNYLEALRKIGVLPLDVFLSTAYTVQPSSTTAKNFFSFLLADRAQRREILAELLGLKVYAMREAYAKDRIRALDTALAGLTAQIRQSEPEALKVPDALERVAAVERRLTDAKAARDALQAALEGLRAAAVDAQRRVAEVTPYGAQQEALGAEIQDMQRRYVATLKTLETARADIAAAESVMDAPALKERLVAQRATLLPLRAQLVAITAEIASLDAERAEIEQTITRDEEVLAREAEILAAVSRSTELQAAIVALDADISLKMTADSAALSTYQYWLSIRNDLRMKCIEVEHLETQVKTMEQVPCQGQEAYVGCKFLTQAAAAGAALPAVRAAVAALEAQVGDDRTEPIATAPTSQHQRAVLVSERDALAPIVARQVELASARSRVDAMSDRNVRLAVTLDDKRRDRDTFATAVATLPDIEAALRDVEPSLAIARKAEPARAVANGATIALDDLRRLLEEKQIALAAVDTAVAPLPMLRREAEQLGIGVTTKADDCRRAESLVGATERELGAARAELTRYEEAARTLEQRRADRVVQQGHLDDWVLIAKSQSPVGIPALRVDRALPEIGARATELLRECLGQIVFTIQLVTQKASADDKKLLETLDVLILRNGKVMDAALLSGGEGVLVSEALALSIALYNADRGQRSYTLFRDEVGAALDVDAAPAYTRLLSKAAKIGGFNKVLFVTHHQRSLELADARLQFGNGEVVVS